ncbi:MAG: hypothetical protein GXW99_06375 [Clostridiales bacterium]|nr:hypothetical protein [Clostridiales bacterium]
MTGKNTGQKGKTKTAKPAGTETVVPSFFKRNAICAIVSASPQIILLIIRAIFTKSNVLNQQES